MKEPSHANKKGDRLALQQPSTAELPFIWSISFAVLPRCQVKISSDPQNLQVFLGGT